MRQLSKTSKELDSIKGNLQVRAPLFPFLTDYSGMLKKGGWLWVPLEPWDYFEGLCFRTLKKWLKNSAQPVIHSFSSTVLAYNEPLHTWGLIYQKQISDMSFVLTISPPDMNTNAKLFWKWNSCSWGTVVKTGKLLQGDSVEKSVPTLFEKRAPKGAHQLSDISFQV